MLDGGGAAYAQTHAAGPNDPQVPDTNMAQGESFPGPSAVPAGRDTERSGGRERKTRAMLAAFNSLRLNLGMSDVRESVILDCFDVWRANRGAGSEGWDQYVLGIGHGRERPR